MEGFSEGFVEGFSEGFVEGFQKVLRSRWWIMKFTFMEILNF